MPRFKITYKLFFSFASDVGEERKSLYKAQRIINLIKRNEYQIEIIDYKNDTFPDSGKHPQAQINKQIGIDYDFYLSVIRHRIGSPTPNFSSGIIEEFEKAQKASKPSLIFFANFLPRKPYQLDSAQYHGVDSFRKTLGSRKILYDTYESLEDFDEKIIVKLCWKIDDIHEYSDAKSNYEMEVFDLKDSEELSDEVLDFGLDELSDFEEFIEKYGESIFEIEVALLNLLKMLISNMQILSNRVETGFEFELKTRKQKAKKIYKNIAERMLSFKRQCDTQSVILDRMYSELAGSLKNAIIFFPVKTLDQNEKDSLIDCHSNIKNMINTISEITTEIEGIRSNIYDLRKFNSHIKKAQKVFNLSLIEINEQVENYKNSLIEFEYMYLERMKEHV